MTKSVDISKRKANLLLQWQISSNYPTIDGLTMEVSLKRDDKVIYKDSYPMYTFCGKQEMDLDDVDFWWPRGYYKAPFYTNSNAHFVSKIGYHGCPNRTSLEKMFEPDYVYPWNENGDWNDQWQTKAVKSLPNIKGQDMRNNLMLKQIDTLFGERVKDLD